MSGAVTWQVSLEPTHSGKWEYVTMGRDAETEGDFSARQGGDGRRRVSVLPLTPPLYKTKAAHLRSWLLPCKV